MKKSSIQNARSIKSITPAPLAFKPRRIVPPPQPASRLSGADQKKAWRLRKPALIITSMAAASFSLYVTYIIMMYKKEITTSEQLNISKDVSDRYDKIAESFDSDMDTVEWAMNITRRRKQLADKAVGHVLEASAGTGRNMAYWPLEKGKIKSVTMVDKSAEMTDIARVKWGKTNAWFINAIFRVQDAADPVPCPSPKGFDTVVQTMGLCSTPEPEKLLRNLGEMTNPDGGRILLLEHGRGYYNWLNSLIDKIAPAHANRYGCWFNKDIQEIVNRSGLEVVELRRYDFGTLYHYELKPVPKALPPTGNEKQTVRDDRSIVGQKSSWSWWWT